MSNFSFLPLLLIFLSCQHNLETNHEISCLEYLDDFRIPIDAQTSSEGDVYYFHEGIFYLLNRQKQRIQLYDWESKELIKKIQLAEEGPDGVGSATGLLVQNPDSIFVVAGFEYKLSLLNGDGTLLKHFSLFTGGAGMAENDIVPSGGYSGLVLGSIENPLYKLGDFVIAGVHPFLDPFNQIFYEKGKVCMALNLREDTLGYVMPYPKFYLDKFLAGSRFTPQFAHSSSCFNPHRNLIVTSFTLLDDLQILDFKTSRYDAKFAGSSEFKEIKLPTQVIKDPMKAFKFTISNTYYGYIKYDPVSRTYWRLVNHPNPQKVDETDDRPWVLQSLVILDEDFNKLCELKLDFATDGSIHFTDDGAYIWAYDKNTEDEILFKHYKVVRK